MLATVTWLKLTWTAAAAVGVLVTFALLAMAFDDLRLLKHRGVNSWRQYVANTSMLIFVGGFGTQIVYFVVGMISLSEPLPHDHIQTRQYFAQGLFLFGALSSIFLAIAIFYRRRRIIEVIEEHILESESNHEDTSSN